MPIKQGMVMHVGHWTQFITAKVEAVTESAEPKKPTLTLTLDKPLVYCPNDKAVLMYLEGAKLRVAGTDASLQPLPCPHKVKEKQKHKTNFCVNILKYQNL